MSDFPTRLKEAMDELGVSNVELARACGVDKSNITHWLNGTTDPNRIGATALRKAAVRLNRTVDYLVTGRGPKSPDTESPSLAEQVAQLERDLRATTRAMQGIAKVLSVMTPAAAVELRQVWERLTPAVPQSGVLSALVAFLDGLEHTSTQNRPHETARSPRKRGGP